MRAFNTRYVKAWMDLQQVWLPWRISSACSPYPALHHIWNVYCYTFTWTETIRGSLTVGLSLSFWTLGSDMIELSLSISVTSRTSTTDLGSSVSWNVLKPSDYDELSSINVKAITWKTVLNTSVHGERPMVGLIQNKIAKAESHPGKSIWFNTFRILQFWMKMKQS